MSSETSSRNTQANSRDTGAVKFEPAIELDRASHLPLHAQISAPIRRAILEGHILPGTPIENEISMAQRLKVSRPTARQALQSLVEGGFLLRRRGVGTIVAPQPKRQLMRLPSLHEELQAEGHESSTEILQYNHRRATEAIAEQLGVEVDAPVIELERLRKRDGVPVAILYNWLSAEIAPSRDQLDGHGLYELLRRAGVELTSTTQSVGAERPDKREAKLLAISMRDPVLTIDRTAFNSRGDIVEWGFHIYRGDLYRYESTVFAQPEI
ncbi:GntR family transcriptional regulator [Trueperella pecoris]|uniref:GntR family transcriptional regulator n=1 Tax=Trueperella pecoris TaxID=2733571 RepID=A0A7M1QWL1_9ACTO|nr:GntR family transcriptional regulator [Trueperella pecoris]QOQ39638.1 GntR family transcriptional regulator [Trueperella pecoris]QOR45735.1 GntR family transcriptional regulator [Trueperella pecoris]